MDEMVLVSGGTAPIPSDGPEGPNGPDSPDPVEWTRDEAAEESIEEQFPGTDWKCYSNQDGDAFCENQPATPLPIPFEYPDGSTDLTT